MAKQQTVEQLAALQAAVVQLQEQKDAEDAAEAAFAAQAALTPTSDRVKNLGVQLHTLLCTQTHDGSAGGCAWRKETTDFDDAALADWAKTEHALWLNRARSGIQTMKDLGFTVTDPA